MNPFDIWAPDCRCDMNNTAFSAYAYHEQQIEDFIEALAASPDPNDGAAQIRIAASVGISPNSLTPDELRYIEREVEKRYG